MTREWKTKAGLPWVMRCDRPGCDTEVGPFDESPPLADFASAGWFVAKLYGDRCPVCVTKGLVDKVEPYPLTPSPIDVPGGPL